MLELVVVVVEGVVVVEVGRVEGWTHLAVVMFTTLVLLVAARRVSPLTSFFLSQPDTYSCWSQRTVNIIKRNFTFRLNTN